MKKTSRQVDQETNETTQTKGSKGGVGQKLMFEPAEEIIGSGDQKLEERRAGKMMGADMSGAKGLLFIGKRAFNRGAVIVSWEDQPERQLSGDQIGEQVEIMKYRGFGWAGLRRVGEVNQAQGSGRTTSLSTILCN